MQDLSCCACVSRTNEHCDAATVVKTGILLAGIVRRHDGINTRGIERAASQICLHMITKNSDSYEIVHTNSLAHPRRGCTTTGQPD